jgi:hypothetical protein
MTYSPILIPVVALVAWTLLIMLWMLVTRLGEFKRLGVTLTNIPDGARGVDLEGKAEAKAQWKSHNYNHLMEQPTIFYAIAITLALMDFGGGLNYWLAWGYVGFRVLHSLIQCTVNTVRYRLALFSLASACLFGLTIHAGLKVLHDCGLIG